jgi:citrate lyase beta subunit
MVGAYGGYKDSAGLDRLCLIARALCFDGKQCIHPSQLSTVNSVFSPSDEEVGKAGALVKAYEAAVAAGQGAASHDGRMIDAVSLRMAQTILARHQMIRPA